MILILNNGNDCYGSQYYEYLASNGIKSIKVGINQLIKTQIADKTILNITNNRWTYDEQGIDISKVTGVYHSFEYFDSSLFQDYSQEDQEYAREEWFAYLVYFLNKFERNINPIPHTRFSGTLFSVPGLYKTADKVGFARPNYFFGNNAYEYLTDKTNYIAYNSLFSSYTPIKSAHNDEAILYVEKPTGVPLVIHVIDNDVYATLINNKISEPYNLSDRLKLKCLNLKHYLSMNVIEILLFLNTDNRITFYGVSLYPSWNMSYLALENVFGMLTAYLTYD